MDQKQSKSSKPNDLTRRKFMRDGAATAAGLAVGLGAAGSNSAYAEGVISKTRNYNPEMEYRRLGKTNIWVSAVCLGGHWKRVDKMVPGVFKGGGWLSADLNDPEFQKNRHEVVSRCIEHGINCIDACTYAEIQAYSKALEGRRDQMYLGFSWYEQEARRADRRTAGRLTETLDGAMKVCKLDHVDLWRITCCVDGSRDKDGNYVMTHTMGESEEIAKALDMAKQSGKVSHTGVSSHDRVWLAMIMEKFSDQIEVVVTPYTAKSKVLPKHSMFDAAIKYNCGIFGIKPFASNSLFEGDSSPDGPTAEQDDRRARLAIRYILNNPAITAPIPGMINSHQVDNVAKAVKERRQLDVAEAKELEEAMDEAWARLPADYQWPKNWEYV